MRPTWFDFRRLAAIYVGGVLVALARVGLAQAIPHAPGGRPLCAFCANKGGPMDPRFPRGVLVINVAGTLVPGLIAGAALEGEALVIVAGGGIGSFTTFSTWMLDSHRLADAGHTHLVWLNLVLSLVVGFAA